MVNEMTDIVLKMIIWYQCLMYYLIYRIFNKTYGIIIITYGIKYMIYSSNVRC